MLLLNMILCFSLVLADIEYVIYPRTDTEPAAREEFDRYIRSIGLQSDKLYVSTSPKTGIFRFWIVELSHEEKD